MPLLNYKVFVKRLILLCCEIARCIIPCALFWRTILGLLLCELNIQFLLIIIATLSVYFFLLFEGLHLPECFYVNAATTNRFKLLVKIELNPERQGVRKLQKNLNIASYGALLL